MSEHPFDAEERPSAALSVVLFLACTGLMAVVRLYLVRDHLLALTYGVPLLLCLWHRDRRLLWTMAGAFVLLATIKTRVILPRSGVHDPWMVSQWFLQVLDVAAIGITVHIIIGLRLRLRRKFLRLQRAHDQIRRQAEELAEQSEELARQNEELGWQGEELQQQNEELNRQNEELRQQSEELEGQSEELRIQSEDLEAVNRELSRREAVLQAMLGSMRHLGRETEMLESLCGLVVDLIGEPSVAAAVLEAVDGYLVVRTRSGLDGLGVDRWPLEHSFAAIVLEHDRTGYIDDVAERPDIRIPEAGERRFRSVLAAPLNVNGGFRGAVEVYSIEPHQWTTTQFRVLEWVAGQCSIAIEAARLRDELARANTVLERSVAERTARLKETVEELEHFSYTITHDMRAPLRAMQGFAGLMQELCEGCLTPDKKDCLHRIVTSAARMDRLITDALTYGRALQQELPLAAVEPADLLRGIIQSYPALQPPSSRIEVEGEIPPVLANEAGLTQCFSNLLGNAVKFVEPGTIPHVRIRAVEEDGVVRLWFEDNGIGIPEQLKLRLFEMFQRGSKSYEGTGVGLALVKKVAERMGGRVGVESELGHGSRFWLELRCAMAAQPGGRAES